MIQKVTQNMMEIGQNRRKSTFKSNNFFIKTIVQKSLHMFTS